MDIALQLWSIKEEVEENFDNALGLVEKAGYNGVEFAGYHGRSPEDLQKMLAAHHLKAVGAHVGIDRFRTAFDEEMAYAKALGFRFLICPWLDCNSEEEIIADAKVLEECAQKARAEGLVVAYHNHDQEFKKFGARYALDIILDNAPSVKWEADVFWVAFAGLDPVAHMRPYVESGRVCLVHAKEIAKTGTGNVYIGEGRIDFMAVAQLCPPAEYTFIVEQEEFTSDHYDAICKCIQGLRKALV